MIVCKKTAGWYIEWHRITTSDNEWKQVVQRITTTDNKWHRMVQRMATSDSTSDNGWCSKRQRTTTSNKKWQWVTARDSEWWNELIQMKVSKIEWFYVSRETKGQSGRPIHFLNIFIQFSMQYVTTIRISRSQMFFEIGVFKVCKIHREMPVLEPLFSKVASLGACKFIKKRLQHRRLPVNIANLLRI